MHVLLACIAYAVCTSSVTASKRQYDFTTHKVNISSAAVPFQVSLAASTISCTVRCLQTQTCLTFEYEEGTRQCRLYDLLFRVPEVDNEGAIVLGGPEQNLVMAHAVVPHSSVLWPATTTPVVLASLTFQKQYSNSALRATFFGAIGGYFCKDCVSTYHIRFNGQDCSSPQNIDKHTAVVSDPAGIRYFPSILETVCYSLSGGNIVVDILGEIQTLPTNTTIACGYDSHILLEEILPHPDEAPSWKHYMTSTGYWDQIPVSWSVQFSKKEAGSWLLLNWVVNIRVKKGCVRWFIKINGTDCSSPGPLEGQFDRPIWANTHHNGPIGGICKNVPAGNLLVEPSSGPCHGRTVQDMGMYLSSWTAEDNLFVEEIKPNPFPSRPLLSPINLHSHRWTGQFASNSAYGGIITSFIFNKVFDSSTLRFKFFGNLGLHNPTANQAGAVWCFKIDGLHCSNPGPMCTVLYSNIAGDDHLPFELMGICSGVGRGQVSVRFTVDPWGGAVNATTGEPAAAAASWIIADEIFL